MDKVISVAKKELSTYFSSPIAFIFLGTFLVVLMFSFFWVEQFFARNIVDVRPLFDWFPILLIFLVAALTMKMWSEERRMGTLEFLLTMPVETHQLVLGKFFACLGLVAVALVLTIGIPITVSFMGYLDWGPVIGAYIAALLLAGAYTAIGLYVSARSDNQIVSLIVTAILCFVFYLFGSATIGSLLGNFWGEFFKLLGTGSRFESINRGVIDLRDLYYYISIVGVFLALNVSALEKLKWAHETKKPTHSKLKIFTLLVVLNFIVANFWLQKTNAARVDLTEGSVYSISDATRTVIDQLQEPLLIRGYFSAKTHPLLAPLVPQVRDMLKEYEVAGHGKIRAEFIEPEKEPELEEEANRKFNIKPLPFQVSDRYQASLLNSYFDILVSYGDKWETLGFRDLIEVKPENNGNLDVRLRNFEYDLTRSIKKVLYGFKNTESLFATLKRPVTFNGFVSAEGKLPKQLRDFRGDLQKALDNLKGAAAGKFEFSFFEPESSNNQLAKEIEETYGFKPMATDLFGTNSFYFYMILKDQDKVVQIPLPDDFNEAGAKRTIEAALKRFSPGFLKTVGLVSPDAPEMQPWMQQMGQMPQGKQFMFLQDKLGENFSVTKADIKKGTVADNIDLLLVAAPENLDKKQLFAIDQFLMKGGTVVLLAGGYSITQSQQNVSAKAVVSGLDAWLKSYGIDLQTKLVLDAQNEPYPIPVTRNIGGFSLQEIRMVNYPLWVDVRADGMAKDSLITGGIPQVTINWPSPIVIDKEKNKDRTVTTLLHSSNESWVTETGKIEPNFKVFGELGFPKDGKQEPSVLAAVVEGHFDSFFKGQNSPLLEKEEKKEDEHADEGKDPAEKKKEETPNAIGSVVEKSPTSSRLIIFGSNEFASDQTLQISAATGSSRYLNSVQIIENAIDWSLEDRGLLSIRSRGQFSRTMLPMTDRTRMFWEYLNYLLVLVGLAGVFFIHRISQARDRAYYTQLLAA